MQRDNVRELSQKLGTLRYSAELSQKEVARFCGVTAVTVRNWENAKFKPTLANLKKLIELYLDKKAFLSGMEYTEAVALWLLVQPAVIFDENWFASLMMKLGSAALKKRESLPLIDPIVSSGVVSEVGIFPISHSGHTDLFLQDRMRMLDKVYSLWIKGYLNPLLTEFGSIPVPLHESPSVVNYPFRSLQRGLKPALNRSIPSIVDIFDDAHEKLLILGASDRERTIALLTLLQEVLKRAHLNDFYPIPVLFHLSSWSQQRLSISDWLIEELSTKYQISRSLSQAWVARKQIFSLIDGLEEVHLEHRAECIESINNFLLDSGLIPTVVCSNSAYYLSQPQQLLLYGAVTVQQAEVLC